MSKNIEITLNGVNVSRCKYLNNSKEGLLCTLYDYDVFYDMRCADNPDCYYKQLQREKQKNKELTEDFNELCKRHNEAFEEFNKLKQTNKKLRKTLKEIEEIADNCDTPPCSDFMEFYECKKRCKDETSDNGKRCMYRGLAKILEKVKGVKNERQI